MRIFLFLFSLYFLSLTSCKTKVEKEVKNKKDTLQVENPPKTDSALIEVTKESVDTFFKQMSSFQDRFTEYKAKSPDLIDSYDSIETHWLLKSVIGQRKWLSQEPNPYNLKRINKLPGSADFQLIDKIRTAEFKGSTGLKDISFENWSFSDKNKAYHWLAILSDSLRGSFFTKPPRFQWVEGKDLFLITARSAGHWYGFKDSLAVHMTNRTVRQLSIIYNPINLKHFKKMSGPSHGGPSHGGPSHGGPSHGGPSHGGPSHGGPSHGSTTANISKDSLFDYKGHGYYEYFYFKSHRLKGEERAEAKMEYPSKEDFSIITTLHIPYTTKGKFNEMQETLVQLNCAIEDSDLSVYDLVNKPTDILEPLFGKMIEQNGDFQIYGYNDRIISVKVSNELIDSFSYRWIR